MFVCTFKTAILLYFYFENNGAFLATFLISLTIL